MASIEDRWYIERDAEGGKVKVPTARLGKGMQWRAHWRDPAGKTCNRSFKLKRDADKFLTTVESSKLTNTYVDAGRAKVTVGELATQWFAGKINLKPTTRAVYESALDVHVRPRWATTPIGKVEHGDVQVWLAALDASGISGGHVRKIHGVLSGILALAVKDRRIPSNPALGADLPAVTERARKYLTAAQVEQLADAAGDGRAAVLTLAYCGLRWSELAGLRVGRVDLLRRRLVIAETMTEINGGKLSWGTPKSNESRSVPIPRFLVDVLAIELAGKAPGDLAFTTASGAPLRNRNARRAWFDDAAAAIGEPDLTPHELRHTAASLAVSAGANVKAVQRMLGHASAAMTLDRYADLFDDDLDAVADRLDVVRAAGVSQAFPEPKLLILH